MQHMPNLYAPLNFPNARMAILAVGTVLAFGMFEASHAAQAQDQSVPMGNAIASATEAVGIDKPKPGVAPEFRIGDTLRISFFEKFDQPEEKWSGAARTPALAFHQFTELCGEYVVQDDGTLSFPIMGRVSASGRSRDDVLADLTRMFEGIAGRAGFVNIIATEHQPVFVAGSVKSPGAFKYWQGMTVLHAIALAGGPKIADAENWQRVESGREVERLQRALARVKRLLVRTNLLRAESGEDPLPPVALASLVGNDAPTLVSDERAARNLTDRSRTAAEIALKTAVDDARRNLQARTDRLGPLDTLIAARLDRSKTIQQLADRDSVSRPVLVQIESELAEAQDRKRQAMIEVAQAKNQVAEAEHALANHETADSIDLARTAQSTERDTQEAVTDAEGALTMMATLLPDAGRSEGDRNSFQVVRKAGTSTVVLDLPGTAPLEPGDLVRAGLPADPAQR